MPLIVSFRVRESYTSNVNFCNLCLKICVEKEKHAGPQFYWNLTSSISVYCRSNAKAHTGWSKLLYHLGENECSEQVSENYRNGKIFCRQNFSVGNIFRQHLIFVGKYIRHLTKNSPLFTDKVFTDKVGSFITVLKSSVNPTNKGIFEKWLESMKNGRWKNVEKIWHVTSSLE